MLATRKTKLPYLTDRLSALGVRGREGAAVLGELLRARTGTTVADSRPQRILEQLIIDAGLPPGIPEFVIVPAGGRTRRVDLGWPAPRMAFQVESYRWHSSLRAHSDDTIRDADVVAEGWTVLRGTPDQVRRDPDRVLDLVRRALEVRGALLS